MTTFMEELQVELDRNRELAQAYDAIPTGGIDAVLIRRDIQLAERAIAQGDTVTMLKVYAALKNNE